MHIIEPEGKGCYQWKSQCLRRYQGALVHLRHQASFQGIIWKQKLLIPTMTFISLCHCI